jgi:hypothetical protein
MEYYEIFKSMNDAQRDAAIEKLFDYIDADKSGKISLREFKTVMLAAWYEKIPSGILDIEEKEEEILSNQEA